MTGWSTQLDTFKSSAVSATNHSMPSMGHKKCIPTINTICGPSLNETVTLYLSVWVLVNWAARSWKHKKQTSFSWHIKAASNQIRTKELVQFSWMGGEEEEEEANNKYLRQSAKWFADRCKRFEIGAGNTRVYIIYFLPSQHHQQKHFTVDNWSTV